MSQLSRRRVEIRKRKTELVFLFAHPFWFPGTSVHPIWKFDGYAFKFQLRCASGCNGLTRVFSAIFIFYHLLAEQYIQGNSYEGTWIYFVEICTAKMV